MFRHSAAPTTTMPWTFHSPPRNRRPPGRRKSIRESARFHRWPTGRCFLHQPTASQRPMPPWLPWGNRRKGCGHLGSLVMSSPGAVSPRSKVFNLPGRAIDPADIDARNSEEQTVFVCPGDAERGNPQRGGRKRNSALGLIPRNARIDVGEHRRQGASISGERQLTTPS